MGQLTISNQFLNGATIISLPITMVILTNLIFLGLQLVKKNEEFKLVSTLILKYSKKERKTAGKLSCQKQAGHQLGRTRALRMA